MSHASPFAVVPDETRAKVDKYGLGILSQWAPQQTILSHPVRSPHTRIVQLAKHGLYRSQGGLLHMVDKMESLSLSKQEYQCTCLTTHAYYELC